MSRNGCASLSPEEQRARIAKMRRRRKREIVVERRDRQTAAIAAAVKAAETLTRTRQLVRCHKCPHMRLALDLERAAGKP